MSRHPIEDRELPEWIQRQIEEADPLPPPWSIRRRVTLGVAAALFLWAILIFAFIGAAAVFGVEL